MSYLDYIINKQDDMAYQTWKELYYELEGEKELYLGKISELKKENEHLQEKWDESREENQELREKLILSQSKNTESAYEDMSLEQLQKALQECKDEKKELGDEVCVDYEIAEIKKFMKKKKKSDN